MKVGARRVGHAACHTRRMADNIKTCAASGGRIPHDLNRACGIGGSRRSSGSSSVSHHITSRSSRTHQFSSVGHHFLSSSGAIQTRDVSMRVGWDPEGILGPPKGGHIARRQFQRAAEQDASLKKKLEEETAKIKKELEEKRNARILPTEGNHEAVVQFLLDTETEEMSIEVARVKNCLTPEWFKYVEDAARMAKFDSTESYREDRHAELEALVVVVREELDTLEEASAQLIEPADKLRGLFTSSDKKQFILDMAGRNEIDAPFLQLIRQNIRSAEDAGQEDAAKFMKKLMDMCQRYETKPKAAKVKKETTPEIITTS